MNFKNILCPARIPGYLFLIAVMIVYSGNGIAQQLSTEKLKQDLRSVIVLEGFYCQKITNIIRNSISDYTVGCNNGKRYRVYITDEGQISVTHSSSSEQQVPIDHHSRVKIQLTTIISLAGKDCISVVEYSQLTHGSHLATCSNGYRYRVHVSSEGRISVSE